MAAPPKPGSAATWTPYDMEDSDEYDGEEDEEEDEDEVRYFLLYTSCLSVFDYDTHYRRR